MSVSETYIDHLEEIDLAHLAMAKGAKLAAWDVGRHYNAKYKAKHGKGAEEAVIDKVIKNPKANKATKAVVQKGIAHPINWAEKKTIHEPVEGAKSFIKQSAHMTKHQTGQSVNKAKEGVKKAVESAGEAKRKLQVLGKRPQPATA